MSVISPVVTKEDGPIIGYEFFCPGCQHSHWFPTHESQRIIWQFNDNVDSPTFSPSLLNHKPWKSDHQDRCHLFVRDGKIQFLDDCYHELSGQTVEMEEVES